MKNLLKNIIVVLTIVVGACGVNNFIPGNSAGPAKQEAAVPQNNTATATANASAKVSDTIVGRVVRISDGDTITVLQNNRQYKIRLNGIDAPEHFQPFGEKAREYLKGMINQKTVTVKTFGKDRYGRYIGQISTDKIADINGEMIKGGFAWHYKQYSKSKDYAQWENEAKAAKKGLWSQANPQAPWDYRRSQKNKQKK